METRTISTQLDDIDQLIKNTKFSEKMTNQLNQQFAKIKAELDNNTLLSCPISNEYFSIDNPAYTILTHCHIQTVISLAVKIKFEKQFITRDPYTRFQILGYELDTKRMELINNVEKNLDLMKDEIRNKNEIFVENNIDTSEILDTKSIQTQIDEIEEIIVSAKFSENITDQLNKKLMEFKERLTCPISMECFSVDNPPYTILTGHGIETVISLSTKNDLERKNIKNDPYTTYTILGYKLNIKRMEFVKRAEEKLALMKQLIQDEIENPTELAEFNLQFYLIEDEEKQIEGAALFHSFLFSQPVRNHFDFTKYHINNKLDLSNRYINNKEVYESIVPYLEQHPEITTLLLRGSRIIGGGVRALARIRTLKSLDLSNSPIGDAGAKVLAKNTTLISLNVSGCKIEDAGIIALAESKTLLSLDVSGNYIELEGIEALAKNTTLRSLNVSRCALVQEEIEALANNTTLTWLDVSRNKIGNAGAIALAQNKTLTTLIMELCEIKTEGAKKLAENKSLKFLSLKLNAVFFEGAEALAQNTTLKLLDLSCNNLGSNAAKALSKNETLRILNLSQTFNIKSAGAIELAKNKTLLSLDLSFNEIGDEGAIALAKNLTLKELYLSGSSSHETKIGNKGFQALAQNETLAELELDGNMVEFAGGKLWLAVPTFVKTEDGYQKFYEHNEIMINSPNEIHRIRKAAKLLTKSEIAKQQHQITIDIESILPVDSIKEPAPKKPCAP